MKIKIFHKNEQYLGFNFQEGFAYFFEDTNINATSGWNINGFLMVYKYNKENNNWFGDWELINDNLQLVLDKIKEYEENKEIKEVREYIKNYHPDELAQGDFEFTDVISGRHSDNGGDYGFYSHYKMIEPGIYRYSTSTTCDFDDCGTGFEGYVALTWKNVEKLKKHEQKVCEKGCQY
ncbi:MAG: hypothetical protein ABF289_18115 [Clostridiales bacterium]